MNTLDAPPAASSAAETSPASTLETLSSDAMHEWRLKGSTFPTTDLPTPTADSSPAEPAEQVAETSATPEPASEPGTPKTKAKSATSRKPELESEIQALLQRRHQIREELAADERRLQTRQPDAIPAASSPARAPETVESALARPDVSQPILSEAQWFERFPGSAYGDYTRYTARYELAVARQEESREREQAAQGDRLRTMASDFSARYQKMVAEQPDFAATIDPRVGGLIPAFQLRPEQVQPIHVLAEEVMRSPVGPLLMQHFSAHYDELTQLAAMDVKSMLRGLGRLEARLESPPSSVPPAPKTTSSAPAPPTTLGKKPSLPSDAVESALASGDFGRYADEMNRRELAAR